MAPPESSTAAPEGTTATCQPAKAASNTSIIDFRALLLGTLGHRDDEFVSIGREISSESWHTVVTTPDDAVSGVPQIPAHVNVYFGVNPVRAPVRADAGRGTETDVTRLAAIPVDLDIKP